MPKFTMEGYATMKCPIDSMNCELFYLIILMICCIGGQGGALDLMQDCRWIPIWGLVSLYRVAAHQRATWHFVG